VTKLDLLARSLPDARDILDELTRRNVQLSLGGSIHDPTHPVGRLLFHVLVRCPPGSFTFGGVRARVCRRGEMLRVDTQADEARDPGRISAEENAARCLPGRRPSVRDLADAPLAMVAEFEADLTTMRTREGLKVAKNELLGKPAQ
jgi:DNA invertase Pin-like site-specific DNA recombinase